METATLITQIKNNFLPDVSRTKILEYADGIQKLLFGHDCFNTLFFDTSASSTFPYPILTTVAGTLEYEVKNANLSTSITLNSYATTCRKVSTVYIKSTSPYNLGYSQKYYRKTFDKLYPNPWNITGIDNTIFQKVSCLLIPQRGTQNARIIFNEDPTSSTTKYFVEFHINPITLSSESIPLSVNADDWYDVLIDGIVGYGELIANGNSQRWEKFNSVGKQKFWEYSNEGNEEREYSCSVHEC